MQLSSNLAGQQYQERVATIALAILLFLSVFQSISSLLSNHYSAAILFVFASLVHVVGLLSITRSAATSRSKLRGVFCILITWVALYVAFRSTLPDHWIIFYLLSVCTYFLADLKTANLINLLTWIALLLTQWSQSGTVNPTVGFALFALMLLLTITVKEIQRLEQKLTQLHLTDSVTGCANRATLEQEMAKAVELHKRYHVVTSTLALKLHNFDDIGRENTTEQVNQLLTELTQVWNSRLRNTDLLCRYSDNLFICLLPNTELNNALLLSDDLLNASENYEFSHRLNVRLVASVAENTNEIDVNNWLSRTLS